MAANEGANLAKTDGHSNVHRRPGESGRGQGAAGGGGGHPILAPRATTAMGRNRLVAGAASGHSFYQIGRPRLTPESNGAKGAANRVSTSAGPSGGAFIC